MRRENAYMIYAGQRDEQTTVHIVPKDEIICRLVPKTWLTPTIAISPAGTDEEPTHGNGRRTGERPIARFDPSATRTARWAVVLFRLDISDRSSGSYSVSCRFV